MRYSVAGQNAGDACDVEIPICALFFPAFFAFAAFIKWRWALTLSIHTDRGYSTLDL